MRWAWVRAALGAACAAIFLWLLLRSTGRYAVLSALTHVSFWALGAAGITLAADYSLRIVRWWCLLRPMNADIRLRDCIRPFLASMAVNNVTPMRAGDALRVFGFRDLLQLPVGSVLVTLLVERVLDFVALVLVLAVSLSISPTELLSTGVMLWAAAVGAAAVLGLCASVLWSGSLLRSLDRRMMRQERRSHHWLAALWRTLWQLLRALRTLRSPTLVLRLCLLTAGAWLLEGAVFAWVAAGLAYRGSFCGPWFAMATGTLSTLIPSTPGYIGTFDFFAARGLDAFGATQESATAFAFLVHAVLWIPITVVGLLLLLLPGRPAPTALEASAGRAELSS